MRLLDQAGSRSMVQGTIVEPGRFNFMAAIINTEGYYEATFGAALIAPNVVLSSARSLQKIFGADITTQIALGCDDVSDLANCEIMSVMEVIEYPDYNADGFYSGDLQLLVLERDSLQTPVAIAAPGFEQSAGQDLTVLGWVETIYFNPEYNEKGGPLRELTMEMVSQTSCDKQYRDILGFQNNTLEDSHVEPYADEIIDESRFCTVAEDGKGLCSRDGRGSPAYGSPTIQRCDATGKDVLVGLVASLDVSCMANGVPDVYTKIYHPDIFEFIKANVEDLGHSLMIVDNAEEFCLVGGTKPVETLSDPPTPFPTFDLSSWTCYPSDFADGYRCNCNCGIPDPDCEVENDYNIAGCFEDQHCIDGICVDPQTHYPTPAPFAEPDIGYPTSVPFIAPTTYYPFPTFSPSLGDTNFPTPSPAEVTDHCEAEGDCDDDKYCIDGICADQQPNNPTPEPIFAPTTSDPQPSYSPSFDDTPVDVIPDCEVEEDCDDKQLCIDGICVDQQSNYPTPEPIFAPTTADPQPPYSPSLGDTSFPTASPGDVNDLKVDQNSSMNIIGWIALVLALVVFLASFLYFRRAQKMLYGNRSREEVKSGDFKDNHSL